jgi:hypothetical protein
MGQIRLVSETVVGCSVTLLVLSIVFITCFDLGLPKRKVSRGFLEAFGLLYFALVLSVIRLTSLQASADASAKERAVVLRARGLGARKAIPQGIG